MRVAILSDTHGFVDPRIADRVAECEYAVHAGDIGGADVLLALHPRKQLLAVRGNNDSNDKWAPHERHFLETLPEEARLDLPGGQLIAVHGHDAEPAAWRHTALRRRYPEARVICYGHSHRMVFDDETVPWVINPGAAGRTRTYGGPSFVIIDCAEEAWVVDVIRLPPRKYRSL